MIKQTYNLAITVPDNFADTADNYTTNAAVVNNSLAETFTNTDNIKTLTKEANLQSFQVQAEITHESISAVIEFECTEKVKLQKGILKKIIAEKWPLPKLHFTLNCVGSSEAEAPAAVA